MAAITWPVPSAPSEELSDSILFTRKWDLSDVALKAKDSDTLLYANKNVLAVHSDYFKTLFFSDFAESKQDVVVVNLSYWAMLAILRVIHHVDRRFGADTRALMPVDKLVELYKAGDYCDIALIREYSKYEISRHSPSISVEAYIKLDMTKEKTAELKRMKYDEIQLCLKRGIPGLIFSAEDVRIIVDKCLEAEVKRIRCWKCGKSELVGNKEGDVTTGHYFSVSTVESSALVEAIIPCAGCSSLCPVISSPMVCLGASLRLIQLLFSTCSMSKVASSSFAADVMSIDFTKPWDLSDVALKLKDSDNLLHANKMVLSVNSVFFKTLFLSDSFAESKQKIVSVDISYWSMHCVLRILHHTAIHFGGGPSVRIPVAQLIELYRAADYCDVALIRQLCKHEMSKLPFPAALEVYITLGLSKEKTEVLKHMNYTDIEIYLMKGIPGAIFSAEDIAIMLEKCKEIESKKARCLKCGKAQVVGKKQNGDIVSAWCLSCKAHFKIK